MSRKPRPPANPDELRLYALVPATLAAVLREHPGKLAAQAGHAFLDALDASAAHPQAAARQRAADYRAPSTGRAKIVLLAADELELRLLQQVYAPLYGTALVEDEGRTVFGAPTVTALGIGPISWNQLGTRVQELGRF